MKQLFTLLIVLWSHQTLMAQNNGIRTLRTLETTMTLEGRVLNEDGTPISGANVEGKMGRYATTDALGRFKLPANMGEEIVIRGLDFETVYYRIRSNEDIEIRVQNPDQDTKKLSSISYHVAMDSAQFYLKKDAQKTADFLIAALSNDSSSLTTAQQSAVYEKLGDLYKLNKQYDLAIDNYTQAETLEKSFKITIKKADALQLNGNYQEAITAYNTPYFSNKKAGKSTPLSIKDQLSRLNGLGDTYAKTNNNKKAIEYYKIALDIAQTSDLKNPVTTINSKIAALLNEIGQVDDAESYYNTAIKESKKESAKANVVTQSQTADFYNSHAQFDKEIALRKNNIQLLDGIAAEKKRVKGKPESITTDNKEGFLNSPEVMAHSESISESYEMEEITVHSPVETTSITTATENINLGLTKQKEQLKIAEALKAQNKISEAITFFEASLEEATVNNDLAIKKDASKSLYKLHKQAGNTKKALSYNELYINTIDALYLKKENELEETARKEKELVSKQTRILTLEKDRKLTENKIALINTQRELTEEMNQRQRWIIYSLIALSLLLLTLAYFMYRNNKQHKINNLLLALKSLRSQMNPHFIFNALNSVNNYIAQNDERAANKYLTDFSKLMRSVLENSELDFIPLEKEIDLLGLYLKLEHERFKDKFDFKITVDPAIDNTKLEVPPMLLQPIIENSVWHGLRYKEEKGFLKIAFAKAENGIQVTITDNGIGRKKSKAIKTEHQKKRDSKGLGNIKKRVALLNELHDCEIEIILTDAGLSPDVGTTVVVRFQT
ncbi:histidine kinase [uncultured Nonlabens sp.]|uniref:histidine kinase n=1 Tax=uncultured Nonlabens sp. TaxID=859306 RepID=UPI00260A0AF1|nr:histidine kinase [uncultured Nonlabens sp.]